MRTIIIISVFFVFFTSVNKCFAQSFYFGADLSYVNELQDCGAAYTESGVAKDPYTIFREHGANLIRLRLWHTPSWYDGLNQGHRYSDFQDVRHSIMRAKAEGMQVLLDFHLSDTWADPGHQVAPAAWISVLNNLPVLQDSLYNYIYSTLVNLAADNLLPEIVQIGNETNRGILLSQQTNDAGWSLDWTRNSALFNTAISAVRDVESAFSTPIKIALHIANPTESDWLMKGFWDHGVRDFNIIGLSYYWQFHTVQFDVVGNTISTLKQTYPGKEVMILETGYQWTSANDDSANNILSAVYPGYTPPTPARQKQWMIDLAQTVIDHGGKGLIYWEPAWVSTNCFTRFGKGSNWDNATFFDFNSNLQESGGIGWMSYPYVFTSAVHDVNTTSDHLEVFQAGNEIIFKRNDASILNETFKIDILSIDGKKINGFNFNPDWRNDMMRLKMPELAQGCYFISGFQKDNFLFSKMLITITY
ncbi:MAG: glycosyl hydrolase 53 family protein [Saprospiraceae bacterium]|uniref:Arabinogalactan endo-beta-1,4-galactanase n=1 Tax=Candidatus Opimibacter skivensis TaxID=2982028 RepID=A0A9D7SUG3_9BACT|nr:glycosyl hydrolase 53 family protein [Candidatus Opimibacter skivensis]